MLDDASERVCKRMYQQAMDFQYDADLLAGSGQNRSGGEFLLSILALELLLKCALKLSGGNPIHTHNYFELWQNLNQPLRVSLLKKASSRSGWYPDSDDLLEVLTALTEAFIHGRYEYDIHSELNQAEFSKIGKHWDGNPKTSDYATYPSERRSLIYALRCHLETELGVNSDVTI